MAAYPELHTYFKEAREKGMSDEEITKALFDAGWQMHHFVDFFLDKSHELPGDIISVHGLSKFYGSFKALDNVDFKVRKGSVTALLGPNGAGKTTLVRILTTLLKPDSGDVEVAGLQVQRDSGRLRSLIGLAGQFAAVDEILTGRENLEMVGSLYHLRPSIARERASILLSQFGLEDAADRQVKTYSGGMKRRLDLAASLVIKPKILFLDEPTSGLDPRSRFDLWHVIRDLVQDGTSVLLTTQYLEEADQLANHIYVIDHGRIIAEGTADELKNKVGGDVAELHLESKADIDRTLRIIEPIGKGAPHVDLDNSVITVPIEGGTTTFLNIVREVNGSGINIRDFSLRRPSLDDVFLKLTREEIKIN